MSNRENLVERRSCPRKQIKLRMHFKSIKHGVISEPRETWADDLSASGLGMKCGSKLEPGQMLVITVFLPSKDKHNSISQSSKFEESGYQTVIIYSKVVWCSMLNGRYRAGLRFLELDEFCRQRFKNFLIDYKLDWANSHIVN